MGEEHWRKSLLTAGASMQDAVCSLDQSGLKIVLIVDDDGALLGTVSDGDIRRGLLRGLGLNAAVAEIVHRDPLIVPPQLSVEAVLHLMRANKIVQLPIVDERRRVIGLHVWEDLQAPTARPNIMMIMAGGRGTRLGAETQDCPKPLLPVGGKPMLEHIIERARADGFHRFVLAIHHLGHMIEEYFGDGSRFGVDISYLREESPLGTAGALGLLDPRPEGAFVVTNGDVLTDLRYSEIVDFHDRHIATATMAVRSYEWQHPFGVVHTRGVEITGFEEKPVFRSHVNAGIYVIEPSALDTLDRGESCDMPNFFERLQAASARTIVYPMHEPWLDVGRPDDLQQARNAYTPAPA
ncbi:MAG: NTP transferase domain-containing protein [Sphingosinicella sp.]|nr:NTP transferase domain-containing protein [Sphingosinicella sp.]